MINKKIFFITCLVLLSTVGLVANAQVDNEIWQNTGGGHSSDDLLWGGQQEEFSSTLGLSEFDPRIMIANILNIGMGFVGIITVIIIMLAGFKILLAEGNEDAIGQAKSAIWGTAVGTFIILSSFSIAKFFIGSLVSASGLY